MAADTKIGGDVYGALGIAWLLISVGALIGDTMVGALLSLPVFLLLAYCMTRVPLRTSLMALMFIAFAAEQPGDAEGRWTGPYAGFGTMMTTHLNTIDRGLGFTSWMSFSGIDLFIVTLFVIAYLRRKNGSRIDRDGFVPAPKQLKQLAYVVFAGMVLTEISGMWRGGLFNMSLWQLNRVMYLPTVFLLGAMAFRGAPDLGSLAKVVLSAATYKALVATWVAQTVEVPPDPETGLPGKIVCATNHGDSVLFALAFVTILAMVFERVRGRGKWIAVALLPLLSLGMISNNRRMAWVEVGIVFLIVYVVARDNPVKRKIRRALLASSPLLALYVMAGWSSKAGLFKPVQILRSVVDPQSDGSTMWREYENFNIITTFQQHPIMGTGYGNGYIEFMPMPEIPYELEHYAPHNSILGLWCYAGYFGFLAIASLWVGGIYFGLRVYHSAKEPAQRAAALVSFGSVVIYLAQCWGDMGMGTWPGVFSVGPAIAIAGKLLVSVGEWNLRPSPKRTAFAARQTAQARVDPRAA